VVDFDQCLSGNTARCSECGREDRVVPKEHRRKCRRQACNVGSYLCPKCYRRHPVVVAARKSSQARAWSSREARERASRASRAFWDGLSGEERSRRSREAMSGEVRRRIGETVSRKFAEDEGYRQRVCAARCRYWLDDGYRAKRRRILDSQREAGTGIFAPMPRISGIQRTLYAILDELGVEHVPEHRIGHYAFDCFLPDHGVLIECNGDYFHNTPVHVRNDKAKTTYVERYFPELKVRTIWEHEFLCRGKVVELVRSWTGADVGMVHVDLSDLSVVPIGNREAVEFIQKYHYTYSLGHGRSQIRFGAVMDGELVAVCTFAGVTRNESLIRLGRSPGEVRELTRLCRRAGYENRNLLSWFLSRSMRMLRGVRSSTRLLLSFADGTFGHSGSVYRACNWKFDGWSGRSYWYVDRDGFVMHKKTMYNHARKMGMREAELAAERGYVRKWGLRRARFVFEY